VPQESRRRPQSRFQAKADYEQWRVGASNFERMISGALAEINDIWELRGQQRGE
jgi:hypothetical protein